MKQLLLYLCIIATLIVNPQQNNTLMNKHYIIENGKSKTEMPKRLIHILKYRFKVGRIYWFGVSEDFKRDPEGSLKRMLSFNTGDSMIGQTNFHEEDQLERMILVMERLMLMNIRLNFYTILSEEKFGTMADAFKKYLKRDMPYYLIPDADEDTNKYHKHALNRALIKVVKYHYMYRVISTRPADDQRLLLDERLIHNEVYV